MINVTSFEDEKCNLLNLEFLEEITGFKVVSCLSCIDWKSRMGETTGLFLALYLFSFDNCSFVFFFFKFLLEYDSFGGNTL